MIMNLYIHSFGIILKQVLLSAKKLILFVLSAYLFLKNCIFYTNSFRIIKNNCLTSKLFSLLQENYITYLRCKEKIP